MNVYNVTYKNLATASGSNWAFIFYREVICYLWTKNSCSYVSGSVFLWCKLRLYWLISSDELPERLPSYNLNVQEADNRIWRHTYRLYTLSEATKVLIMCIVEHT